MLRLDQIKLTLQDDESLLKDKILKILSISESDLLHYEIYKKNIDARHQCILFVYSVDVEVKDEEAILKKKWKNIRKSPKQEYNYPEQGIIEMKHRPVVVGFGPAGMFAALALARNGYKPRIFEQGKQVEQRIKDVQKFVETGELDESSNIQFGEGGAGTFSDGKLTARTKDLRVQKIYEELINHGAPHEILTDAYPHIGSDRLIEVVANMRKTIIALGGTFHFSSKVDALISVNDRITGIEVNHQIIDADVVVLALGNSARDSFVKFHKQGLAMESKPYAIGVRIEHTQESIDKALYHEYYNHESLHAASYRLTHQHNGLGIYTFCMCPGGEVVAATSRRGHVVVNGMSDYARDNVNANSAILVQVNEEDYGEGVFAGMEFQEKLERKAFELGGSNYKAPAQRVGNFLQVPVQGEEIKPSYPLGVNYIDLHSLLPEKVCMGLREGLLAFARKNEAFKNTNAVLTGVETRSSSPVRILREKETLQSCSIRNVYPVGEGSGYSGGITSSAIDGLKGAEAIIEKFSSPDEIESK
ncbi:NAD(P)/FAD-dependent oxidoreductase [Breznakia pachnodae]|uniref:FAD-dependent dehydrogenase n=1 Tax=Breznakia pachnodae TaxID=265178 RepID=A0ABU0E5M9_9FIRM|nr:hypothetical protein [Breznakia pachnodae]MDQ0362208.1 putative FAD-dependent dehydrogenase [Breznakia pachnodae]